MSAQAYALFFVFLGCSIVLGLLTAWLVGRTGGPRARKAIVLPILGGFLAFYLIGHKLGFEIGPRVPMFGFEVSLIGDLAIGFAAALAAAALQAAIVRVRRPA